MLELKRESSDVGKAGVRAPGEINRQGPALKNSQKEQCF